jgi:hypothetical protein
MSLRPAQALVAESSKFSLRTFFESSNSGGSGSPVPASVDAIPEGLPTLNPSVLPPQMMMMASSHPEPEQHPPSPTSAVPHPLAATGVLRPTSAPAAPSAGKFTFNGLMPTTTQVQLQHKILQQHQQAALQSGLAGATNSSKTSTISDQNEVLRLKAQVLSLTERTNQLNANLASTSESVVRGNKALTTERAQFHAKFAGLTKKLEATQAALAEAEALPVEAAKNAKLLNAKILELQEENHQLTQTRATLEATIEAKAAEVAALHEASQTSVETQAALQAQCDDLTSKYATLAKQHSMVLARQDELTEELQEHQVALAETSARADAAMAELEAAKVDVATADQLVDELDAKLAETRVEATGEAVEAEETWTIAEREAAIDAPAVEAEVEAPVVEEEVVEAPVSCCPKTMRCEELERLAVEAHGRMHCAEEADCERLAEEHRFADAMAKRARWSLTNDVEERVVVAHLYTDTECCMDDAACLLGASIRDNPLTVAKPFDDSFHLMRVGAAAAATEGGASERTNAFVQAVSADLKFHMDDTQALYKSSSTTGTALKI